MSLDKETMEKEVEQAVSAFEETSAPKNWTAARNSKRRSVLWI
ncbi:MAG: hypothetical protein ACLR7U_11595 [Ruthenibacterium lactatiformans]